MARIYESKEDPEPLTEALVVRKAWSEFSAPYMFPNVYYRREFEADGFLLTSSNYGIELEAKLTMADWKRDFKKKKHDDPKFIKHFYYCAPEDLANNPPEGVPEYAGIISIYLENGWWYSKIVRGAKDLKLGKVPRQVIERCFRSMYHRYHQINWDYQEMCRRFNQLEKENKTLREEKNDK